MGFFLKIVTTDLFFNSLLFPVLKISWAKNLVWINKRAREENNPRYIHRDNKDVLRMNLLQRFLLKFQNKKALDNDYFIKRNLAKIYLNELKDLIDKKIIYIPGVYIKNSEYSLDGILHIIKFQSLLVIERNY